MRITKQIATTVAEQLCAAKSEEVKALRKKSQEFIFLTYLKTIPSEVFECWEKHPDFFRETSSMYINGPGLPAGYKTYSIGSKLPCIHGDRFTVAEEEATVIQNYENDIEARKKEINELKTNIEAALINLRTYNNVEKEFPEAFNLLPASIVNTGLMVNIKDIRCKLDKNNC